MYSALGQSIIPFLEIYPLKVTITTSLHIFSTIIINPHLFTITISIYIHTIIEHSNNNIIFQVDFQWKIC